MSFYYAKNLGERCRRRLNFDSPEQKSFVTLENIILGFAALSLGEGQQREKPTTAKTETKKLEPSWDSSFDGNAKSAIPFEIWLDSRQREKVQTGKADDDLVMDTSLEDYFADFRSLIWNDEEETSTK